MMTSEKRVSQPSAVPSLARSPGGGPAPLYSTQTEETEVLSSSRR